jgi:Family of unknown function (DUF5522)
MEQSAPDELNPRDLPEIEGEDYYFDGPYLVFTEAYHRRRGFCCQSGCRHCPYGFRKNGPPAAASSDTNTD